MFFLFKKIKEMTDLKKFVLFLIICFEIALVVFIIKTGAMMKNINMTEFKILIGFIFTALLFQVIIISRFLKHK